MHAHRGGRVGRSCHIGRCGTSGQVPLESQAQNRTNPIGGSASSTHHSSMKVKKLLGHVAPCTRLLRMVGVSVLWNGINHGPAAQSSFQSLNNASRSSGVGCAPKPSTMSLYSPVTAATAFTGCRNWKLMFIRDSGARCGKPVLAM